MRGPRWDSGEEASIASRLLCADALGDLTARCRKIMHDADIAVWPELFELLELWFTSLAEMGGLLEHSKEKDCVTEETARRISLSLLMIAATSSVMLDGIAGKKAIPVEDWETLAGLVETFLRASMQQEDGEVPVSVSSSGATVLKVVPS